MRAGELDRRITLQRQGAAVDDGYTSKAGVFAELATVWAKLMPLSGAERAAAGELNASAKVTFMVRRQPALDSLNAKDRLLYNGRVHDILFVRELGREGLLIDTAARADG